MAQPGGFQRVEQAFLAAAWDSSRWDDAMQAVSDEIGAFGAGLVPVVGTPPKLAVAPRAHELFGDYVATGWHVRDERRTPASISVFMRDGAVVDQDFLTADDIKRSEMYQDFFLKRGFGYFCAFKLTAAGNAVDNTWGVTIQRSLRDGPFNAEEKARLARWGRKLSAAATLSATLAQAKLNAVADFLEALDRPCVQLSRLGTITHLNGKAEALLGADMWVQRRHLCFSDRAASLTYDRAVAAMLDRGAGIYTNGPLIIARGGKAPLALHLVSTDFADTAPFSPARILVLINDLAARPLTKADELRKAFGLTGMEARLGEILSNGTSLPDAADTLRIADQTARTHLKSIFSKTETNRQTALIALLARLKR